MKLKSKLRKLMITTGIVLAFGLLSAGCSAKESVPTESTAVETEAETKDPFSLGGVDVKVETNAPKVDIIAEESGAYVGTTPAGETQYAFDKYGPLGKEVWDSIALQWTTRDLNTESDLRATMDVTYGQLSTKEELTQDILALTRDPQPQPQQESLTANPETKAQPKETKPAESKAQPKETQTAPKPKENHTAESQSQPTSNESQTPQTQQSNTNTNNNGLIPGTDIPSTGDPDIDAILKGNNDMGGQVDTDKMVENAPKEYEDQGKGLDWN